MEQFFKLICPSQQQKASYNQAFQQQVAIVAKKLDVPQPLNDLQMLSNLYGMPDDNPQATKWTANYKVVYTSRTHSQLAQAMKELKVTEYRTLNGVALGSRDQLCINEEVLKEATTSGEKVHMCRAKIKAKQCSYHSRVDAVLGSQDVANETILDIEDLVRVGKKCNACPYYMSKTLSGAADIVFLPYNYVLDPKLLKSFKLSLDNAIVILDEAHNVEKVCQDAASVQIASSDIATCIEDITHIMKKMEDKIDQITIDDDTAADFTVEDCAKLKEIMLELEKQVDAIDQVTTKGRTLAGGKIFDLLSAADITQLTYPHIMKLIASLLEFLTQASVGKAFGRKGFGLTKVGELIDTVYGSMTQDVQGWRQSMERGYRVHVELEEPKAKRGGRTGDGWLSTTSVQTTLNNNAKVINYWCFNPGFGMANLTSRNVHSIILTSGTLAPLKPLISELALAVDYKLENPHVIQPSQILAKIISKGPDGTPLNGNFGNRDNPKYVHSLGLVIRTVANFTPNGLLVFFPSYTVMNKAQDVWQQSGMWKSINDVKPIFTEPKRKAEFDECMSSYYEAVKLTRGAIFMAVLRGKVSEGLDFKDQNGRAVIVIGLPFPPFFDARVVLKKEYLETNRTVKNQLQTGGDWYNMEATRAVNQAIGRVIRHKDDYGAILLCDQRFHNYKQGLSKWVQQHIQQSNGQFQFGPVIKELGKFFRNALTMLPTPIEVKQEPLDDTSHQVKTEDLGSARIKMETAIKSQMKIENSNEIYGRNSASTKVDYIKMERFVKKEEKPTTFMGGLDTDITSIDFNCTESPSLPTVRKLSPLKNELAVKKQKLTLTPNVPMIQEPVKVKRADFEEEIPENRQEFLSLVS